MLVAGEEPQAVTHERTTEPGGHVAIHAALVTAALSGVANGHEHGLAGKAGRLPVRRRVQREPVTALPGDHVDHRSLQIAVLG